MSGGGFIRDLCPREERFRARARDIMNSTNHHIPRSRRPDWPILISTTFERLRARFGL